MRTVKRAIDLELELIYASQGGQLDIGHATFEGTLGVDVITIDIPYSTWVELGKPNTITTLVRAE